MDEWSGCLLKIWTLFRNDGSFHRADLEANAAVNAGVEIDPVEVGSLFVFPLALVNASHRAGIHAVGDALAHVSDDGMSHGCTG